MNIDYKKGLINGIIIFVVAYVAAIVVGILGLDTSFMIGSVVSLAVLAVSAFVLAQKAGLSDAGSALSYGILTAVVIMVIQYAIGRSIPTDIPALVGFALVILVPLTTIKKAAA